MVHGVSEVLVERRSAIGGSDTGSFTEFGPAELRKKEGETPTAKITTQSSPAEYTPAHQ